MFNEYDERYIKELCEDWRKVAEQHDKAVAKGIDKDERLLYGAVCVNLGMIYGVIRYIGDLNGTQYTINTVYGTVRIKNENTGEEVEF